VTDVHFLSGYPLAFEVQSGTGTQAYRAELTEQPYLRGEHLTIDEPHVYADIMDLVDAILMDRLPRATGEQARHVVDIIEKARQAIRTGRTQELTSTFNPVTIDDLGRA
jgi:predicted dehydrogenase